MNDITFNIYGGSNQILPSATHAEQNFYGDKYADDATQKKGANNLTSPEVQRLRIYINNVEALAEYVGRLEECRSAKELGFIVADMVEDERTSVNTGVMAKKEFRDVLAPIMPNITTGDDNIRKYINEAYDERKRQRRQQQLHNQHSQSV